MDFASIVQAITTVGFPIICCLLLGWYVKYMSDKYREQIHTITEQHANEMKEMAITINNNTMALQKLCDQLENNYVKTV